QWCAPEHQDAGGLRHALDQEHAGHHRVVRKVAEKLRLVDGDVLDADAGVVAADVDDAIDHDERVTVRQEPQDLADLGGLDRLRTRGRVHGPPSSDLPAAWAGISPRTLLCPAMMAPSPIVTFSVTPA